MKSDPFYKFYNVTRTAYKNKSVYVGETKGIPRIVVNSINSGTYVAYIVPPYMRLEEVETAGMDMLMQNISYGDTDGVLVRFVYGTKKCDYIVPEWNAPTTPDELMGMFDNWPKWKKDTPTVAAIMSRMATRDVIQIKGGKHA